MTTSPSLSFDSSRTQLALLLILIIALQAHVSLVEGTLWTPSDHCPVVCGCLGAHVDCSRRGLTEVPRDLPTWAETLELQGNKLSNLTPGVFTGLHRLQKLDLSANRLASISRPVLADLRQLTTLSIRRNDLTAVPLGIESLATLRKLDLRGNNIRKLSPLDISRLAKVADVDLARNKLAVWPNSTVINGDCVLKKLDLASNRLTNLHASAFTSLSTLRDLKLARNRITRIHKDAFKGLVSLRTLDLSRNRLKEIEGVTFRGLSHLESLSLARNGLKKLHDGALWGLDSVKELDLSNNKLSVVANGWMYGAASLLRLYLSKNEIGQVDPTAWAYCPLLEHLNLSSNHLKSLPAGSFRKLIDLKELVLANNSLEWIEDETFKDLLSLESLDLSNNSLSESVEDSTRPFSKHLAALQTLNLASNNLRSLPSRAFRRLNQLRLLDLSSNDVTTVNIDTFDGLQKLLHLYINSTSLLCDCKLDWLAAWLREWQLSGEGSYVCGHPAALKGKSIFDVDPVNMTCDNSPKPTIASQPRSQPGVSNGDAIFSCTATANDHSDLTIEWKLAKESSQSRTLYPEGGSLEVDTETDAENGTVTSHLKLFGLTREDSAYYQCVARNRFGSAYSRRAFLTVNVFPSFLKKPTNITLQPGRNARLECSATGYPTPVIRWRKDGGDDFPAALERRVHVMPTDDVFFIVNVKAADSGLYTCTAGNEAGEVHSSALITVLEKPSFRQPMTDQTKEAGHTVVFACLAEGTPVPKIDWYFNGRPIFAGGRVSFTSEMQMLVLVEVGQSDAGTYTCQISSRLGAQKQSASLTVFGDNTAKFGNGSVIPRGRMPFDPTDGQWWVELESLELIGAIAMMLLMVVLITSLVWAIVVWCRVRRSRKEYRETAESVQALSRNSSRLGREKSAKNDYITVAKDEIMPCRNISLPDSRPGFLTTYSDGSHSYATSNSLKAPRPSPRRPNAKNSGFDNPYRNHQGRPMPCHEPVGAQESVRTTEVVGKRQFHAGHPQSPADPANDPTSSLDSGVYNDCRKNRKSNNKSNKGRSTEKQKNSTSTSSSGGSTCSAEGGRGRSPQLSAVQNNYVHYPEIVTRSVSPPSEATTVTQKSSSCSRTGHQQDSRVYENCQPSRREFSV